MNRDTFRARMSEIDAAVACGAMTADSALLARVALIHGAYDYESTLEREKRP